MAAAQGIDFRKQHMGTHARLGRGTAPVYALIRKHIPFIAEDTLLYPYMEAVRQLVVTGAIDSAAQNVDMV
jgi:histidine ammonia-lyase